MGRVDHGPSLGRPVLGHALNDTDIVTVSVSPELGSALYRAEHDMRLYIEEFEDLGGSRDACLKMRECHAHIASLSAMCKGTQVSRDEALTLLTTAAKSIAEGQLEIISALPGLKPGRAEMFFASCGYILGAIVLVAAVVFAPQLGPMVGWYGGMGSCFGLAGANLWAARREGPRVRCELFGLGLTALRDEVVRAEVASTMAHIQLTLSPEARRCYAQLLKSPPERSFSAEPSVNEAPLVNGEPSGPQPLPEMRVPAYLNDSRLGRFLWLLHTGAISLRSAADRKDLCAMLEDEVKARQQDRLEHFENEEAVRQRFDALTRTGVDYRDPILEIVWTGEQAESRIAPDGLERRMFDRGLATDCGVLKVPAPDVKTVPPLRALA